MTKIRMGSFRNSSLIKSVGFSCAAGDTGTLRIQCDDALIDFAQVPWSVFKGLVRSGKNASHFYLRNIYGAYSYQKI